MSYWKQREVKKRDYLQLELKDLETKFKCPISKITYENFLVHRQECIYKYCKSDWDWKDV